MPCGGLSGDDQSYGPRDEGFDEDIYQDRDRVEVMAKRLEIERKYEVPGPDLFYERRKPGYDNPPPSYLCYVMRRYELGHTFQEAMEDHPQVAAWYQRHKEADEKRNKDRVRRGEEEIVRLRAVAKLTPQERAALGLNDTF